RLAGDVERAAFVPKDITPSAGSRRLAAGVASQRDRARSGDHNNSVPLRCRAGQRDHRIDGHDERPSALHNRTEDLQTILWTAAYAEKVFHGNWYSLAPLYSTTCRMPQSTARSRKSSAPNCPSKAST